MEINEVLANAGATALLGIVAAVGGKINAWLTKKKIETKEFAEISEKLRALYKSLGVDQPIIVQSTNEAFAEIRKLENFIQHLKAGK